MVGLVLREILVYISAVEPSTFMSETPLTACSLAEAPELRRVTAKAAHTHIFGLIINSSQAIRFSSSPQLPAHDTQQG